VPIASNTTPLTPAEALGHAWFILGTGDYVEIGVVTSRQKCKHCGQMGKWAVVQARPRWYLECAACGKWWSISPVIRLRFKGRRMVITATKQGERFASVERAHQELESIRTAIKDGTFSPDDYRGRRGSALLWSNWLKAHRLRMERQKSRATLAKYRSMWAHLADAFPGLKIGEVRKGHIADVLSRFNVSPKYKADILGELRRLFNDALDREEIDRLPSFPAVRVPERPIYYLTPEQQARVLENIEEPHRPIARLLVEHGIRPAEACALCWDAVDLEKGLFWLARTFSRRRLVNTTKGGAAMALPITSEDEEVFGLAAEVYLGQGVLPRGELPVFQNPTKSRNPRAKNEARFYSPDLLADRWRKAVAAAGLEPIGLYPSTRHSKAMKLKFEGVSDEVIARVLCHRSGGQHIKKYARADVRLVREVLESGSQPGNKRLSLVGKGRSDDDI